MSIDAFLAISDDSGATPGGNGERREIGDSLTIGRDASAELTLGVAGLSRQHAMVERRRDGYWAVDLESRNGTFVNGEPLATGGTRLEDGDTIVLGGAVTLVFRDPMATPIAPRIGRLTGLWIDPETDAVWVDAQRVEPPLSGRQMRLLHLLYDAQGEVVTRATIIDDVWDDAAAEGVSDDALAALIKRLRARLKDFESDITHVEIVRGRGLRLKNVW